MMWMEPRVSVKCCRKPSTAASDWQCFNPVFCAFFAQFFGCSNEFNICAGQTVNLYTLLDHTDLAIPVQIETPALPAIKACDNSGVTKGKVVSTQTAVYLYWLVWQSFLPESSMKYDRSNEDTSSVDSKRKVGGIYQSSIGGRRRLVQGGIA